MVLIGVLKLILIGKFHILVYFHEKKFFSIFLKLGCLQKNSHYFQLPMWGRSGWIP